MAKLKADYSRASFKEVMAPHDQKCSCGCGETIHCGQVCFARPFINYGKQRGFTRIIDLDHYDDWLESVAHEYAKTIVKRRPEAKQYFGELDD